MRVLQNCLRRICALVVVSNACGPCAGATLLELDKMMLARMPQSDLTAKSTHALGSGVSRAELDTLASHDVVLIIYMSHSMAKTDCLSQSVDSQPDNAYLGDYSKPTVSRWHWCQE